MAPCEAGWQQGSGWRNRWPLCLIQRKTTVRQRDCYCDSVSSREIIVVRRFACKTLRTQECHATTQTTELPWKGMFTKDDSKVFQSKTMNIFSSLLGTLCRTECVRANLVGRAEHGRWGSSYRWLTQPETDPKLLSPWPLPKLPNWVQRVNEPLSEKEIEAVRWSVKRGTLFGNETWVESTVRRLDLESTLRTGVRPRARKLPNNDYRGRDGCCQPPPAQIRT